MEGEGAYKTELERKRLEFNCRIQLQIRHGRIPHTESCVGSCRDLHSNPEPLSALCLHNPPHILRRRRTVCREVLGVREELLQGILVLRSWVGVRRSFPTFLIPNRVLHGATPRS